MASPLLVPASAAALAVVLHAAPAAVATSPAHALIGAHTRLRDRRRVALTFDDGPQPEALDRFLSALEQERARATFFLVGEQALRHPALVREIHAAGHELANHGFRHRNHLLRTPFGVADDIRRGAETIAELIGTRPPLYRPCYGVVAAATWLGARAAGSALVLWSRWGRDWRAAATPLSIVETAAAGLRGGDIVLLHDADHYASPGSWRNTLAALPLLLERVRALGLEPSAIDGVDALA